MSFEIRIFLGYLQSKELKIHLQQSQGWKEAQLKRPPPLIETTWEQKEYVGLFIPSLLTCAQIKEIEKKIRLELESCCPKLCLDKYPAYLLPQLFIF